MLKERQASNNNTLYKKYAKSTEKINPSTKINLSLMDEKLSILNSDIEELYKKYMEKKRLRRHKEKSEQSLVSRINFLIDEERKIRSLIENRTIRNEFLCKNKSVKSIKVPEIFTNSNIMKYNTIESSEDSTLNRNNKFNNTTKENRVIKYINNSNKKSKYNKTTYNRKKLLESRKNGMNEITLSTIQNNSIETNSNNITLGSRANITNNVCIIINNKEKNESKDNTVNRDINLNNISFSKMENIYEDNKRDNYIKNDDNKYGTDNTNINQKYKENIKNYNPFTNNSNENGNKNKINNEINYIKKTLASKLKEDNIQLYQQKENINANINNQKEYGTIEKNKDRNNNENYNPYADMDDKINTPSFKIKLEGESKEKRNKSMRNILNCKIKKLKNLEKEIEQKKSDIRQKKSRIELKKKSNLNLNTDNNNEKQKKRKNKTFKNLDKRCYSKPVNTIGIKNKDLKAFNQNNLNKALNKNKSHMDYDLNKKEDKKIKASDLTNLSIDSDEIILSDANMNAFMAPKKDTKKAKDKPIAIIYHKKNLKREEPNEDKILYEYGSTPNLLNNINLTFNQSIEKKRKLLGLPINVKRNNNLKSKKNGQNKSKDCIIRKEEINKNRKTDKSLRVIYNKRKINQEMKNNNMIGIEKKNDNVNSAKKETDYDNESYPYSNFNNYDSNSVEASSNLFKTNLTNIYKNKDKAANIPVSNSLASIFSTKTNKTSLTNRTYQTNRTLYKNTVNNYINKSNSNLSNFNKFKKCMHSNGSNIYVTRHENKNFLSTIRLVKKREKNINKANQNEEEEKKEEVIIKNINKVIINTNKQEKKDKEKKKEKEKEKEKIKQSKEVAAIRRINQIKEAYKNKGNQITHLNKKFNNRSNMDLYISNGNSNKKKKPYKFQTYRRLSEIQKSPRYSFNNNNRTISIGKSKSNKSLLKGNRSFSSFKY